MTDKTNNNLAGAYLFLVKREKNGVNRTQEYRRVLNSVAGTFGALNGEFFKSIPDEAPCIVANDLPNTNQEQFVSDLIRSIKLNPSRVYAYAGYRFKNLNDGAVSPAQPVYIYNRLPFTPRHLKNDYSDEEIDVMSHGVMACTCKILKKILAAEPGGTNKDETRSVACSDLGIKIVCIVPTKDWSELPRTTRPVDAIIRLSSSEHSTVFSHREWRNPSNVIPKEELTVCATVPVTVIVTTHNRTETAKTTLTSLVEKLKYPDLRWIIADDRSEPGHVEALMKHMHDLGIPDERVSCTRTTEDHFGLGASINNALNEAFRISDVVLTTEDDWYLQYELDISDHVRTIIENPHICTIRLGAANTIRSCLDNYDERYKQISLDKYRNAVSSKKKVGLALNLQVAIRHKRLYDAVGRYVENKHSDIVEYNFGKRYVESNCGMVCLWPSAYDDSTLCNNTNPFLHFGVSTVGHVHPMGIPGQAIKNNSFRIITASKNSMKTIQRCFDSVVSQNYNNFKWVIVDDHSTDGSLELIQKLALDSQSNIEVRMNSGNGMGSAWNTGLDGCEEEDYVMFLDSDDYFTSSSALSLINEKIKQSGNSLDCVILSYRSELTGRDIIFNAKTVDEAISRHASAPWSKCVKSSIYTKSICKFPVNKRCCNDTVQDMRLFSLVKSVASIPTTIVFYSKSGPNSVWNNLEKGGKIPRSNEAAINAVIDTIEELNSEHFENKNLDDLRKRKITSLSKYIPSGYARKEACIMTCIFGGYDSLKEPLAVSDKFEYVCVTDDPTLTSKTWKIVNFNRFSDKSSMYNTYYVKHHPFEFTQLKTCMFIDASLEITDKSVETLIHDFKKSNASIGIVANNMFRSLKDEIDYWSKFFRNDNTNKRFTQKDEQDQIRLINAFGVLNHRSNVNGGLKLYKNTRVADIFNETAWALLKLIPSEGLDICRLDQPILSLVIEKFLEPRDVFVLTREVFHGIPLQRYLHCSDRKVSAIDIDFNDIWLSNTRVVPYRVTKQ